MLTYNLAMKCTSYDECVEQYNQEIRNLWKPVFENTTIPTENTNIKFKQFCFHVKQDESPIWFFGMNPSLPSPPKEIFNPDNDLTDNLIYDLKVEQKEMHGELQYFLKAIEFFENEVKNPKSVVPIFHDLYPVRHTKQKEFVKFLEDNDDFCNSFDTATKNLIDGIMPDIIVIANAKASKLMQKIFFGRNEYNGETKLTYELDWKKSDMIFSSMLSGQRALDTYSRSRLAREISETWKFRNN